MKLETFHFIGITSKFTCTFEGDLHNLASFATCLEILKLRPASLHLLTHFMTVKQLQQQII